jgi:hypothetical protein
MTPFVGKRIERSRTIDPADANRLTVDLDGGDVTLRASDRGTLAVEYVKKSSSVRADLSKLRFRTARSDGSLRLRSAWQGGDGLFSGTPQIDVDATIPRSLSVGRVETDVGDVSVTDVTGDVTLRSSTGDVTAKTVAGSVRAETDTGDVEVVDPAAIGDLRTNTGDVEADVPAIDGATRVTAETGDVTAFVASDLDAELVLRSETGEVSVEGLTLSTLDRTSDVVGSTLRGTLGDGGPRLLLETETGDATVHSLE